MDFSILPNIVDPSAVIADDAVMGEGIFVGKRAVVNAAAHIGDLCIINTGAIVEHDCDVGNYSHISVGSVLCGGVRVGQRTLIGANATVIQERLYRRSGYYDSQKSGGWSYGAQR